MTNEERITMEKSNKIKYENPVLLDLGEMARGKGVFCDAPGSSPGDDCNSQGNGAVLNCNDGNVATDGWCSTTGNTATAGCDPTGSGVG